MSTIKSYKDLKCIWMSSEMVAYKLCEYDFDCDNCKFDKVMRNLSIVNSESIKEYNYNFVIQNAIKLILADNYDDRIIYLKNQLIIKKIFGNIYYIGVNPVVFNLLEDVKKYSAACGGYITTGQEIFSAECGWGEKKFFSPFTFMLLENFDLNSAEFRCNKWFAVINVSQDDENLPRINEQKFNERKNKSIKTLNSLKNSLPKIGNTMMDGGRELNYLYQIIGEKNYKNLLNTFQ